jgi:hypothetical protein
LKWSCRTTTIGHRKFHQSVRYECTDSHHPSSHNTAEPIRDCYFTVSQMM